MGRIHVIATGGTIAMARNEGTSAATLELSGTDLVERLTSPPGLDLPQVTSEEYGPVPSAHFTVEHLWGLRERVSASLDEADVDGVVVTHGTDSLEETAYLLDLTVPGQKPMVTTGAMRVASHPGYEGIANLLSSVRVAAHPETRALGGLVVLNDEIHAARDVTKMHTQSLDSFKSPFFGPLGRVDADRVTINHRVQRETIVTPRLEPRVYLIKLVVGMDAEFLRHAVALGARGVVIEAFGGGRVPPWWFQGVEEAIAQDVAVVIATRCLSGRAYDQYGYTGAYQDLVRLGCLFAGGLNGQKARLRLMAALGAEEDCRQAKALYQSPGAESAQGRATAGQP
jgi:L-asparaginase